MVIAEIPLPVGVGLDPRDLVGDHAADRCAQEGGLAFQQVP
jgi:hypothetical protein